MPAQKMAGGSRQGLLNIMIFHICQNTTPLCSRQSASTEVSSDPVEFLASSQDRDAKSGAVGRYSHGRMVELRSNPRPSQTGTLGPSSAAYMALLFSSPSTGYLNLLGNIKHFSGKKAHFMCDFNGLIGKTNDMIAPVERLGDISSAIAFCWIGTLYPKMGYIEKSPDYTPIHLHTMTSASAR